MTREEKLISILKEKKFHITTAESCTGGLISATLVNVSGASDVLNSAVVTYANEEKTRLLGVSKETLKLHGAVSEETAEEMALGAMKNFDAECSLVSTGVAGPTGGTPEKPVGLVYIGVGIQGKAYTRKCNFTGDRLEIRTKAVNAVIDMAVELLER